MSLIFASGVIAGRFDKLLTTQHLNSFKNLNKNDFLRLLKTHRYGAGKEETFEKIMIEEEKELKIFLESIFEKDDVLFRVLYIKFNHLFLSNLLKSYHLGLKYTKSINDLSTYRETVFEDYLLLGSQSNLSIDEKQWLDNLVNLTKEQDAQNISDVIIKYLYDEINNSVVKLDSYIAKYLINNINIENVLLILRAKRYNKPFEYVKRMLLDGGSIDRDILISYYDKQITDFGNYLQLHFSSEIKNIINNNDSDLILTHINELMELESKKLIEEFSFQNMNMATVIYYVVKKREEIMNLKKMYYQSKED